MSRLYVGGVFVSDAAEQPQVRVTREDGEKWDKSTKQKLADMYPAQRILLEKGLKVFIRGKGVMSRAQAAKMRLEQWTEALTSKDAASESNKKTRAATAAAEVQTGE